MGNHWDLTLKNKSPKYLTQLSFLLLSLSGQRRRTIHVIFIENMKYSETQCNFKFMANIKQSIPGTRLQPISFNTYFVNVNDYIKNSFG